MIKRLLLSIVLAFTLCLCPAWAWGATYYIQNNAGTIEYNTTSCSHAGEWIAGTDLETIMTGKSAGDIFDGCGGTYSGTDIDGDSTLNFQGGTQTLQNATLDTCGAQCILIRYDRSGTIIDNCDVSGASSMGIKIIADNVVVKNSDVHGNTNYGIFVEPSESNTSVTGLEIYSNNVYENGENTAFGNIYIHGLDGYDITGPKIHNNTIWNTSDDTWENLAERGICLYNLGETTALITGAEVYENTLSNIEGDAITAAIDVTNSTFWNNKISNCWRGYHFGGAGSDADDKVIGLIAYSTSDDYDVSGDSDCSGNDCVGLFFDQFSNTSTFRNIMVSGYATILKINNDEGGNTFQNIVGIGFTDYGVHFKDCDGDPNAMYNCTLIAGDATGVAVYISGATNSQQMVIKNNILYSAHNTTSGFDEGTPAENDPQNSYNDIYGFATAFTQGAAGTGDITDDPLFVNAGGTNSWDYKLRSGSPAIGVATTGGSIPTTDFYGHTRTRKTLGSIEYTKEASEAINGGGFF